MKKRKYLILIVIFLLTFLLGINTTIAKNNESVTKITDEEKTEMELIPMDEGIAAAIKSFRHTLKEDINKPVPRGYDCPMCGYNTRSYRTSTTENYIGVVTNPPDYTPGVYRKYELIGHYQLECLDSNCGYKTNYDVFEGYKYVRP